MIRKVVTCGDSFVAGIGCRDLFTQPFGVLVAAELNAELNALARGSASNLAIYLQARYALERLVSPGDLIIIGITSHDRVEWVQEGRQTKGPENFTAANLNYHQYPPHSGYYDGRTYPHFFEDRPDYDPKLLTEQIPAFHDYLSIKKRQSSGSLEYYKRLHSEPTSKLELLLSYGLNISEYHLDRHRDIGMLFAIYSLIVRKGVRCLVLSHDPIARELFHLEDLIDVNWGDLTRDYPDTVKSGHASEEAHVMVANMILERIGT